MLLKSMLFVFCMSMLPIIELRGGILWGAKENLPFWLNYTVCVLGNMLPVPFLLIFARKILDVFATLPKVGVFFAKIIHKAERKAQEIEKVELAGLYAFVAVPLPGTGAWTGSLVATALRMKFLPSFCAIFAGVATSGVIMGIISFGLFGVIDFFM